MKSDAWIVLSMAFVVSLVGGVHAQEAAPGIVLDKAIKALGGEAKLTKAAAFSWKAKGAYRLGGNDIELAVESIVQGLDRNRSLIEMEFGGNKFKGAMVLNGDKGWRHFGDEKYELNKNEFANEARNNYLQVIPSTLLPLKGKAFKIELAKEEKIDDKAASALNVTGPDGKDFTLFFDNDSALPVKLVAKVIDSRGEEFTMESIYSDYKDFDGIMRATKIQINRNGESFMKQEITEFKVLEKIDPTVFTKPE